MILYVSTSEYLADAKGMLYIKESRLDAAVVLSRELARSGLPQAVVHVAPVLCPDPDVTLGTFVQADSVSEWDARSLPMDLPVFDLPVRYVRGPCVSGMTEQINRTTQVMRAKMADRVSYALAYTCRAYGVPFYSLGCVCGHLSGKADMKVRAEVERRLEAILENMPCL